MDPDRKKDLDRYEDRARAVIEKKQVGFGSIGFSDFPEDIQKPYLSYYRYLEKHVHKNSVVVELGAGDGQHSLHIAELSDQFIATDISPTSLELLASRLQKEGAVVETKVADMIRLPFENNSVDVVTSAGSLSYADPVRVDAEIIRVLKPDGYFICVDSLNHNPIYKLNRYIHYLRGHRTKSTLKRMPTTRRIRSLSQQFSEVEIAYFGSVSFASPPLRRIVGANMCTKISCLFDRIPLFNRMAFKFVLCATKPVKKT